METDNERITESHKQEHYGPNRIQTNIIEHFCKLPKKLLPLFFHDPLVALASFWWLEKRSVLPFTVSIIILEEHLVWVLF